MAISTYKVYLMSGTGTGTLTYSKLIDIKDFPDLGGAPEQIETTTLSDSMQTYINGIQKLDALEFTCNYTSTDFATLKALDGSTGHYGVFFGSSTEGSTTTYGTQGKFTFDGELSVYVAGGGVNEVVEMKITIAPSTAIAFSAT